MPWLTTLKQDHLSKELGGKLFCRVTTTVHAGVRRAVRDKVSTKVWSPIRCGPADDLRGIMINAVLRINNELKERF